MQLMNLLKVGQEHVPHTKAKFASFSFIQFFFIPGMLLILFSDVSYAVKDVTEGAEYEFRVSAINESGAGDPSPPSAMVCAKNPNSK